MGQGALEHKGRVDKAKADAIVKSTQNAWLAYEEAALGSDELRPIARAGGNSLGGLGGTVVESLSTLWLLGLEDEFARARDWVAANLTFDKPTNISLFETIIRLSGGLISAYDLTGKVMHLPVLLGDALFLGKATDLAARLAPAWTVAPATGIPDNRARLPVADGGSGEGLANLGEACTATLEWGALALRGGNMTYLLLAERPARVLWGQHPEKGLLSDFVNRSTGAEVTGRINMGGGSDSAYEYMLKHWLLRGKQDEWWRQRWVLAMDEAIARLVRRTPDGSLVWVTDLLVKDNTTSNYLEHLACFWPGNLVLGVMSGAVEGARAELYAEVAAGVTEACYQMYARSPTGLAWDSIHVDPQTGAFKPHPIFKFYWQRPEVLESIYYMHVFTGDIKYQRWGWQIFQSIQEYSKVEGGGYTGFDDPGKVPPVPDDFQQSWLLAETFKYLYLLFAGPEALDLRQCINSCLMETPESAAASYAPSGPLSTSAREAQADAAGLRSADQSPLAKRARREEGSHAEHAAQAPPDRSSAAPAPLRPVVSPHPAPAFLWGGLAPIRGRRGNLPTAQPVTRAWPSPLGGRAHAATPLAGAVAGDPSLDPLEHALKTLEAMEPPSRGQTPRAGAAGTPRSAAGRGHPFPGGFPLPLPLPLQLLHQADQPVSLQGTPMLTGQVPAPWEDAVTPRHQAPAGGSQEHVGATFPRTAFTPPGGMLACAPQSPKGRWQMPGAEPRQATSGTPRAQAAGSVLDTLLGTLPAMVARPPATAPPGSPAAAAAAAGQSRPSTPVAPGSPRDDGLAMCPLIPPGAPRPPRLLSPPRSLQPLLGIPSLPFLPLPQRAPSCFPSYIERHGSPPSIFGIDHGQPGLPQQQQLQHLLYPAGEQRYTADKDLDGQASVGERRG
ncbi:hypothetical protein N2152v2_003044 [Parachlorella kessleri]